MNKRNVTLERLSLGAQEWHARLYGVLRNSLLRDVDDHDIVYIAALMGGDIDDTTFSRVSHRLHGEDYASEALAAIGRIVGADVEAIRRDDMGGYCGDVEYAYLNAGDIYVDTIVRDCRRRQWAIASIAQYLPRR